jgi:spermidine/putrescine transport system permease protein
MSRHALLRSRVGAMTTSLALLFLYLPILTLVVLSFNDNDLTTIWTTASTKWYAAVMQNGDMLRATKNSLIVACSATFFATCISTLAALGLARTGDGTKLWMEGLVGLPLLVPEIVTAVALLILFVMIGFPLGLASVVVAHTVFCIPFAYYPIKSRLASLDPSLMEAASDLYASPRRRLIRVELPLLRAGILAGALLAFISSLGDFVITYFVAGPGATTLPIYIFGLIRLGVTPEVNALSAIFLLGSVIMISLAFMVIQGASQQQKKGNAS